MLGAASQPVASRIDARRPNVTAPLEDRPLLQLLQLKTEQTQTNKSALAIFAWAKAGAGRGLWIRLGILALLSIAAYLAAQRMLGPAVPAHMITRQDIVQTVVASGQVQSPNRIEMSSQISGNVIEVPVKVGQFVEVGEV